MSSLIIREGTKYDIEQVLVLQQRWAMEGITYGFTAANKAFIESRLGEYFLVAELNEEIVGFVYGTVHNAMNMAIMNNNELYLEVEDLYISPKNRASGLGSLLVDEILEVAKENGIERSLLYSSSKDMDSIINFYRKHGYKTWSIQMYK